MDKPLSTRPVSVNSAAISLSERYFDGRQVLWPDAARLLAGLVEPAEQLVGIYNRFFAVSKEPGAGAAQTTKPARIDLQALKASAGKDAVGTITFLVDMAKSEALDALGERAAAAVLLDRHV